MTKGKDIELIDQPIERAKEDEETLQGLFVFAQSAVEQFITQTKEREKMNFEMHAKDVQLEDKKHKRLMIVVVLCILSIFTLCVTAFVTGSPQYVDKIITGAALFFGGTGIAKHFQKNG